MEGEGQRDEAGRQDEPVAPEASGAGRVGELYRVWHDAYRELQQWEASQGREAVRELREVIRQSDGER